MENEIKQPPTNQPAANNKKISPEIKKKIFTIVGILAVVFLAVGTIYWFNVQGRVYIDKSEISAAQVDLSSASGGVLQETFVRLGDYVQENGNIARVGDEIIKARSGGIVIVLNDNIGKNFNKGEVVASIIDPAQLRIVSHVEENKGLKDIKIGQPVIFKVDAFGGKKYYGVVDEISDTSRQSGIVFNISDKREVRQFDVKTRFDINAYPELKNGMSAKVWIYKK
jgi:multidrug resistance efflux pump